MKFSQQGSTVMPPLRRMYNQTASCGRKWHGGAIGGFKIPQPDYDVVPYVRYMHVVAGACFGLLRFAGTGDNEQLMPCSSAFKSRVML
jgi:hypothetical protein